jgi:hypothetical protein
MSDTISRQAAISLPVKPREDRYFQTQSLDDAYDYGWRSLQRCIEKLPSAQPEVSRIEKELRGKSPEEQYEFLYWLLLKFGPTYTDSRLAIIEWLRA